MGGASQSTDNQLMSVVLPADLSPYLDRIKKEAPPSSTLPERLQTGAAVALRINETDALLLVSVGPTVDGVSKAFWVAGLIGDFGNRPKANLDTMGKVLATCDRMAIALGCSEIRIESVDQEWKKRLLPLFGFIASEVAGKIIMRKPLWH